jgi:hypothetical protein
MNKTFSRFPSEIIYGLVAFAVTLIVILYLYFEQFSGNITGFFRIGTVLPLSPLLDPQQTFVFKGELGYDGQQFLSIALDPFLKQDGTIAALDHPSYRYRRILYPLLGYLLGLGSPELIPYALVGINVIAIALIVGFVTAYFKGHLIPEKWAIGVLAIPGIWIVLSLSTADLLGSLLLVAATYWEHRHKAQLMAVMVALAILTRETLLILWLALLINNIVLKRKKFILPLLLALIPGLAWHLYILALKLPGVSGTGNFGLPWVGIAQKVMSLFQGGLTGKNLFEGYLFGLLIIVFGLTIWSSYRSHSHNHTIRWSSWLYLGLFSVSSLLILDYYLNYTRVFMDVYLLGLLIMVDHPLPNRTIFLTASGLASVAFLALHS